MDEKEISLSFNFCLKPISKENIVRINLVIQDSMTIKEALTKAICEFNEKNCEIKV